MKRKELMKILKMSGLSLVIASSLLLSGCGCGNAKTTEKEVATATETKDTKENKIDEKVSDETQTQVASGETEVKEDTKDSKGTEEKSDKSDKTEKSDSTDNSGSTGNTGNSGNGGSSNSGNGGSGNSGNHSGNGGSGNSGNTGNGGNTGSTSHTPTPTPAPSNGGGNSSGGTGSATPTHTHNWIPITQTIHHPAETRQEDQGHYETVVDEPAWDEEVTDFDNICITCYNRSGEVIRLHSQEEVRAHINYHSSIGDSSGNYGWKEFPTGEVIHHEAVTHQEWVSNIVTVTVKEAWDEVVTVGYQCSECGATK